MRKELRTMQNKCRFIESVNDGSVQLRNRTKEETIETLRQMGFAQHAHKSDDEEHQGSFEYLLGMPIYSLTKERVDDLQRKIKEKQGEIEALEKMTVQEIWISELDRFERAYIAELKEREQFFVSSDTKTSINHNHEVNGSSQKPSVKP